MRSRRRRLVEAESLWVTVCAVRMRVVLDGCVVTAGVHGGGWFARVPLVVCWGKRMDEGC
jgi:hypothetical protein